MALARNKYRSWDSIMVTTAKQGRKSKTPPSHKARGWGKTSKPNFKIKLQDPTSESSFKTSLQNPTSKSHGEIARERMKLQILFSSVNL